MNRWRVDSLDQVSVDDILFHGPVKELIIDIQRDHNTITTLAVVGPTEFRERKYRLRGDNEVVDSRVHDKLIQEDEKYLSQQDLEDQGYLPRLMEAQLIK